MLAGKTALVTGSTSGIGLGMARALAADGANVVLNGLGDDALVAELVTEIRGRGVECFHDGADMREPVQIEAMVRRAAHELGRVDIVVNNAGIQHVANIEDFPVERWDAVIAINLSSAFHTIRAALPAMKQAGWGRIVNLASAHGLVASPQKVAYIAAKHGMIGLTKTVALEVATTGVTCNAICPGWVLTPLVQQQIERRGGLDGLSVDDARVAMLSEKQPSRQFVTPEQIGELAVFLCSDAAAQVQGAAWTIDGGWTAQ